MENICIEIVDNKKLGEDDNDISSANVGPNVGPNVATDIMVAKQLDYTENYLLNDLKKIAEYYDLQTRKMKKDVLAESIVLFENNPDNSVTYMKRLQAWHWLNEIKNDPKLKQYILW